MKRVAVLGGGPAGAFAAERLASVGLETILLDEKLAWEKPCGGGLSGKAYTRYPFLLDNDYPKRLIRETKLAAHGAGALRLPLKRPLLIYARLDLNRMLLERAERAGARIEKARVLAITRRDGGWTLRTSGGTLEADFAIVATGARNSLRDVGTEFAPADAMRALGYYVPGRQEHIDIQFLPNLEGYIWVFPRCGHLSAGICGKGEPAPSLRKRLEAFLNERGIAFRGERFYSHLLPALSKAGWRGNRIAGPGWMAVGDAAGTVDPITGEGLYYAIRSADLAAQTLLADEIAAAGKPEAYQRLMRADFAADLECASELACRMYLGRFLLGAVPARMVQFARHSPRFRELVTDLLDGTQPYLGLKRRLTDGLRPTLLEIARSLIAS